MSTVAPPVADPRISRIDSRSALAWIVWPTYLAAALYVVSPHGSRFPAALACIVCFSLVPAVLPDVRPRRYPVLCPLNWVLLPFCLQLVVVPLLICFTGPVRGTLPSLPSDGGINVAFLLSSTAFVSFAVGYRWLNRRSARLKHSPPAPWRVSPVWVVAFAGVGLLGLSLSFEGVSDLVEYYSRPEGNVGIAAAPESGDVLGVLGILLKPFLGFSCVMAWCAWADAPRRSRAGVAGILVTGMTAVLVVLSYGTFGYNRGAFAAPLIALAAVYVARVRRVSPRWILVLGLVALVILTLLRAYRNTDFTLGQAFENKAARELVLERTSLNEELQLYAGAPQFTGFLLERTGYADKLYLGETLIASVMSPVPQLGTSFRSSSGQAIYNRLIYGEQDVADQVVPFTGELFLNFHIAGVIAGFVLLGAAFALIQRRFVAAPSALQAFAWQYAATWLAFLVIGGPSVVSQIYIYFFWPVIAFALIAWLRRTGRQHVRPLSQTDR